METAPTTTPAAVPPADAAVWLRRYHQSAPGAPRLVCLPHAGGAASYFFRLSSDLSPEVEVIAVQYPGRQDRRAEPCVEDTVALAERLVPVVAPLADRPLALFGHSMGATVAFELARRLEHDHGVAVRSLVASARCAPGRHRSHGIHALDDDQIVHELRRLSGTDGSVLVDDEMLALVLPTLRSDYKAAETYRYVPGADLTCPVVGMVGDLDPRVGVAELEAWADHTTGGFSLRVLPGGHFYLADHPEAFAAELRDALAG